MSDPAEAKNNNKGDGDESAEGRGGASQLNVVFAARLPLAMVESELHALFRRAMPEGKVLRTSIALDPVTGVSRGFGFVTCV